MAFTKRPLVDDQTFLFPDLTMDALRAALPGATDAQIAAAVSAYLIAHPVPASDRGVRVNFTSASTWTTAVPAGFTRAPAVSVYLNSGEEIEADVVSTSSNVSVTFPTPFTGYIILT